MSIGIPGFARALLSAALIVSLIGRATIPGGAAGPITTPTSAIQSYQQSVNRGLCAQAFKLIGLGPSHPATEPYLKQCVATKHLSISPIIDPGYRIRRLNAEYTCLGVHLTRSFRGGAVQSSAGWYFMEKTALVSFWHMLLSRSHITSNGKAAAPPRATCAAEIPSYVRPSSAQRIIGSAFLSATTGWIAVSRSGAYVPNGSCAHGIGANCDTAQTVIYRTTDAGTHWQPLLSLTTSGGPLVWIQLFSGRKGLVAADVGSHESGTLFTTSDSGTTWGHWPLPGGYSPDPPTITFPDPQHGWLYRGTGAMGSMAVTVLRTADGGKRWMQVACTRVSFAPQACHRDSSIPFGGDKSFITFANQRSGWLETVSNGGTPSILHSSDGGRTWHDQRVGLPPGVQPPTRTRQIFPMGTFGPPRIFGRVGILPESVGFYRPKPRAGWSRLYLYRSTDAGKHWQFYQRTPVRAPSVAQYASGQGPLVQFLDARHWAAVSGTVIWRTANAGKTWSHVTMHVPPGLRLMSLTFTDPSRGWAEAVPRSQTGGVLGGTTLLWTGDGGRDWRHVAIP